MNQVDYCHMRLVRGKSKGRAGPKGKRKPRQLSWESKLCPVLQSIYDFFKPMKETCTWSNAEDEVCVCFDRRGDFSNGYMRWWEQDGRVLFEFMEDES